MVDRDTRSASDLLPIGAVASTFNVTVGTVRAWERAGKLPAIRTPGGQRRFRRADVDALLAAAERVSA
jgi:excisionase family DNA binding protein